MYTEEDSVRKFLDGDYRSESQLTLGSEDLALVHEQNGAHHLAAIARLPIDDARRLIIYMTGRHALALREAWAEVLTSELPED